MLSAVELLPSEDLVDEEVKLEVVKRRQMLLDRLRAPEPILAGSVRAGDHDGTKTVPTTTTTTSNNNGNNLSLIHISEPTRLLSISYAVFCLKKKKKKHNKNV
eukprot:TRINITY_DN4449_c0_g1_i5.p1 TRINITY_DN4449_c0_g1~~TRINITY_DN4449_c0_g1_i5.p1  ORF type:complete len:103 (-),score=31.28 TRINITY_DN4449_c0_g1_i5:60-368(-)